MAKRYGSTFTGVLDGTRPPARADGALCYGKRRIFREVFDLSTATFAIGDQLVLGRLPIASYFDGGRIVSSVSLGSSTLSIGSAAAPAKYRAAAVLTAVDAPSSFGPAAAFAQAMLTTEEEVIATIAAANLPAAGTLVFEIDLLITA